MKKIKEKKMADGCCAARSCVVKKKFYKRELQKWAKNALYLVGLERVAQEVIGHKKWQRLSVSFGDSDKSEVSSTQEAVVDWSPNEKCIFCANRQDASEDVCSEDDEVSNDEGSRAGSPWSLASDEPLDLSVSAARSRHNGDTNGLSSASFLKVPRIPEKSGRHQKRRSDAGTLMPISVHASSATSTSVEGCVSSAAAAAAAAALARRAYTDDELQLALRDIQDGKLGTRRAAILYGIPRSTLRNKVYKMTMDQRPEDAPALPSTVKYVGSSDGTAENGVNLYSVRPAHLTMDDLVGTTQHTSSTSSSSEMVAVTPQNQLSASESLKRLLRNRMAERLENKRADRLKLPMLPDLIRKLSEERFEQECNRSRERSAATAAAESFILKIPSYKPAKSRSNEASGGGGGDIASTYSSQPSGNKNRSMNSADKGIGVALREIIAKSIAHRDGVCGGGIKKRFSSSSSSSAVGSKRSLECPSTSNVRTSSQDGGGGGGAGSNSNAPRKSSSSSGKRMRAKRGRYRNYDRDNLMEAVRAVRRGEMSVHRAGSYYGVPHSTLEYKVKERHLMRPKKRRMRKRSADTGPGTAVGKCSSPSSSKSSFIDSTGTTGSSSGCPDDDGGLGSSSDEESRKSPLSSADQTRIGALNLDLSLRKSRSIQRPAFSMNAVPASASSATASAVATASSTSSSTAPLWPFALDFTSLNSSNFFASQMMRKLQEDAMTAAAAAAAAQSSSVTNGQSIDNSRDALLLSVLIRNGLQIQATEAATAGRK